MCFGRGRRTPCHVLLDSMRLRARARCAVSRIESGSFSKLGAFTEDIIKGVQALGEILKRTEVELCIFMSMIR